MRLAADKIQIMKRSDVLIFCLCVKRRARLARLEVMVAVDACVGVQDTQLSQQLQEGCLLLGSAGVLGCLSVAGTTADIADAD